MDKARHIEVRDATTWTRLVVLRMERCVKHGQASHIEAGFYNVIMVVTLN